MNHHQILQVLRTLAEPDTAIQSVTAETGGSINDAYQVSTQHGHWFLKTNSASAYPGMFEAEAKGLALLAEYSTFHIPRVQGVANMEDQSWIVMEFIPKGNPPANGWQDAGEALAKLHRAQADTFGLDDDNYIGSLPQVNSPKADWESFFVENRLEPLLRIAVDGGSIHESDLVRRFSKLFSKIGSLFPAEPPALLHGDLWSGNFMFTASGKPCIYDPAAYYGHREMDLAMMQLFGGFNDDMFNSYCQHYPPEQGWQERSGLCNLYPLLVHLILFGESYLWQIKQILKKY